MVQIRTISAMKEFKIPSRPFIPNLLATYFNISRHHQLFNGIFWQGVAQGSSRPYTMSCHVLLHIALLGKSSSTNNALEGLFTSVRPNVLLQVKVFAKLLSTEGAFVLWLQEQEDLY